MRTKFKPWAKPFLDEHQEVQYKLEDLPIIKDLYLEIGSGKGAFLIGIAKLFPSRFFIGVEKNLTCSGYVAKKLVEEELPNAYLINADAEKVLEGLNEDSVNIIYLNFSDPWPKARHHKRRLTSSRFLSLYKKVLKEDGYILQKTDNYDLFLFSKETYLEEGFEIIEEDLDYQLKEDDIMTEYEESFRNEGLPIYRMKVKVK